jgi:hypothetical protein
MSILQLPLGSIRGNPERAALRQGLASSSRFSAALQLMQRQSAASMYCAACAAPIDVGAVWRGDEAYCSVECSLGGKRPA